MSASFDIAGTSHEKLMAQIESAWRRLIDAVDLLPVDRVDEPGVCGRWSLKTLVGHIGFWEEFEAMRLTSERSLVDVDWQAMNDDNERDTARDPYAQLRAELSTRHDRMLATLRSLPALGEERLEELLHDHYLEHAIQIEEWLNRQARLT